MLKAKRGRPPLKDERKRRVNVTIRLTDAVKRKLQAIAEKTGHSLSEEIESRLDESFRLEAEFGSRERMAQFKALASLEQSLTRPGKLLPDESIATFVATAILTLCGITAPARSAGFDSDDLEVQSNAIAKFNRDQQSYDAIRDRLVQGMLSKIDRRP